MRVDMWSLFWMCLEVLSRTEHRRILSAEVSGQIWAWHVIAMASVSGAVQIIYNVCNPRQLPVHPQLGPKKIAMQ